MMNDNNEPKRERPRVARHESSKGVALITKTTPFTKAFRGCRTQRCEDLDA